MSNSDDWMDEAEDSRGWAPAIVLPLAGAAIALAMVVGLGAGVGAGWFAKPPVPVEIPRDLTAIELAAACEPAVEVVSNELDAANLKVEGLQKEVHQSESRVIELEAKLTRRSSGAGPGSSALRAELAAAKAALADAEMALTVALEEKQEVIAQLMATEEKLAQTEEVLEETELKLDDQIQLTERAKEDALVNKWYRFLNNSQLEVCEKGGRKKMGACRETVVAHLKTPAVRDRFAHCVRSAQATPSVAVLDKGELLPDFAKFIDNDDRVVKDWYLLLCDPTLPEAEGFLNEEHLPGSLFRGEREGNDTEFEFDREETEHEDLPQLEYDEPEELDATGEDDFLGVIEDLDEVEDRRRAKAKDERSQPKSVAVAAEPREDVSLLGDIDFSDFDLDEEEEDNARVW